jgi:hypothetical protein
MVTVSISCDDGGRDDGGGRMIVAVIAAAIIAADANGNHRAGDPSKALVEASDA